MIPRHRRDGALWALGVLLLMGFVLKQYWGTLAPGLVWGDGPELAAVAKSLGIAHPTGYPLFTLLAHVWLWLPLGEVAWQTNLLCAVFSTATVGLLAVLLLSWRRALFPEDESEDLLGPMLAGAGSMAYAFALGPWSHATLTEVYPFQVLLQTATILAAWQTTRSGRGLPLLAGLFAVALGHHLLAIVLIPLVGVAAWRVLAPATDRVERLRQAATALGAVGVGLLPLLYLPLRAVQRPAINWGDPSTLERWLGHLLGGHYIDELWLAGQPGTPFRGSGDFGLHLLDRLRAVTGYLLGQVLPPEGLPPFAWILGISIGATALALGVRRLARGSRPFAWGLGVSMGLYLGVVSTYNIHDIVDYQLGLVALLWPVGWLGACELIGDRSGAQEAEATWEESVEPAAPTGAESTDKTSWVDSMVGRLPVPARVLVLAFLMLLPLALFVGHLKVSDRSGFDLGDRYAHRLLDSLPEDAVLVTRGQYATSSAWYQQEALGHRRDVRVVVQDFLSEPWYADSLAGRDLGGLVVPPRADDAGPGMTTVATLEALVEANPEASIFLLASPRQKVLLDRHFDLRPQATLLDADEIGEAFDHGFEPPEARLFRIVGGADGPRGRGP